MTVSSTAEIIEEIKAGRMVVLVDEEDRENEGDIVLAADFVTPEAINFMAKHCRGLICLTLTQARCDELGLNMMVSDGGNGTLNLSIRQIHQRSRMQVVGQRIMREPNAGAAVQQRSGAH